MWLTSQTQKNQRSSSLSPQSSRPARRSRRYCPEVASLEGRTLLSALYAVGSGVGDGSSNLYRIDNYSSAPKATNIGETGAVLTDMAISPKTGRAFGVSFTDLYSINLTTGKATDIGSLGVSGTNALTFNSAGTLYTMSGNSSNLYSVNLTTGHATSVFNTGYASAGDLAFDTNGTLFLTTANDLVKLNVSAKTATDVGPLGVTNLFGLVVDTNGQLYAAQGANNGPTDVMYQINKTTGDATKIAAVASASSLGVYGLAFDAPPPALSINSVTVHEVEGGTVNANFTVSLSPPSTQTVTVHYATANGTATAPNDYTAASGTLTFSPGQTSKQITVVVKDDPADAPGSTETFTVNLSAATNAPISKATGTGTIKEEVAAAGQILYAVGSGVGDGSSNLYQIGNYSSAPKATNIGETGAVLTDMAISPKTGEAYGVSFTDLYSINLTTGKATDIGSLGVSGMNALTFNSTGTLYAMSGNSSNLYSVNLTTGHATSVFNTGYASAGDLAFDTNGTLFLTTANDLVKINLSTKTATDVGPLGVTNLFGLVVDTNGQLYAAQGANNGPTDVMYQINKTTGHATKIAAVASASTLGVYGLSFGAAPSALPLYAVGSGVGDGSSNLYRVDSYGSAPKATNIGETGVVLTDMAISPKTGAAYGVSFTDLYSINLTTGKATHIGSLGVSGMNALTFNSTGTLYAMSADSTNLFSVNLTTGHATAVFNTGYASAGDLAFDTNGTLYLTTATDLVKLNLSTKTATDVGPLGVTNLFGLVIDSTGVIYAAQGANNGATDVMYQINKTTGHATKIAAVAGASNLGVYGLSF